MDHRGNMNHHELIVDHYKHRLSGLEGNIQVDGEESQEDDWPNDIEHVVFLSSN